MFSATPQDVLEACRDGRLIDGKSLAGALWLQNVLSGAWSLDWSGRIPTDVAR